MLRHLRPVLRLRVFAWTTLSLTLLLKPATEEALACASCGSGTGAPIVLAPNEFTKFYLGLGTDFDFWAHDNAGGTSVDRSLQTRTRAVFASGIALNQRSFVTLTASYVWNRASHPATKLGAGFGDPMLHYRLTAVQQDLTQPLVPQLQLVLGHRFVGGRSIRDACAEDCVVKATGSGTEETEIGFDLWSGMSTLKWGIAHSVLFPRERRFAGDITFENGRGYQSVLTLGVAQDQLGKINTGLTHLERESIRINGTNVPQSASQSFGYFVTTEYWPLALHTVRLSFFHGGVAAPWISNRNASGQKSLVLAYIRVFSQDKDTGASESRKDCKRHGPAPRPTVGHVPSFMPPNQQSTHWLR